MEKENKSKGLHSAQRKLYNIKLKALAQYECEKCKDYPCFRGIENMETNFALTCRKYKPKDEKK